MKVMVNGQLVNYEDEGKGDVVLLLHGWGADVKTFAGLAKHLQQQYRVLRIDFPGFGGSERPREDWTVGDYAELTAAFLKKIGVDQLYMIAAHSFGGRVTIKGVATELLSPEKIILMGSAGVKPQKTLKQRIYYLAAKLGKAVTALPLLSKLQPLLRRRLYQSAGSSDYLESADLKQIFLNTINEDLQVYAAKLTLPTLLIWGENDDSTPLSDGQRLNDLIQGSSLVVVPGAGHFVYLDNPVATHEAIDRFVS